MTTTFDPKAEPRNRHERRRHAKFTLGRARLAKRFTERSRAAVREYNLEKARCASPYSPS